MAARLGITQSTVSRWETGILLLSTRDLLAIKSLGGTEILPPVAGVDTGGTDKRDAA